MCTFLNFFFYFDELMKSFCGGGPGKVTPTPKFHFFHFTTQDRDVSISEKNSGTNFFEKHTVSVFGHFFFKFGELNHDSSRLNSCVLIIFSFFFKSGY